MKHGVNVFGTFAAAMLELEYEFDVVTDFEEHLLADESCHDSTTPASSSRVFRCGLLRPALAFMSSLRERRAATLFPKRAERSRQLLSKR